MNFKLFRLIHTEKPYKRYYYEPLKRDNIFFRVIFELKYYILLYIKSLSLPIDSKYNKQLFLGQRKSILKMLCDSFLWTFKYKEICSYYFLYGLDLKGRKLNDYVAYTEFRVLRNILNFRQRENLKTKYTFNYLALTRDKFVFGQFAKSLNIPCPQTIALITNGNISYISQEDMVKYEPLDSLKTKCLDVFCKECTGEGGKGAFPLKIERGHFFVGDHEETFDEIKNRFSNTRYIVQERVKNHSVIEKIYPNSINTVRLTTVIKDGEICFYDAYLRTGANGSVVDNACFGGVVIGITKDGCLTDWGIREPGKSTDLIVKQKHPDTGCLFAGVKLPYYEEMIELSKHFHSYYYGIPSMGWDIAITEKGPVFLEAGEDWEIQLTQIFNGGRRKDFYALHGYALNIKLRKY